jgi:hypothetical protein
MKGTTETTVQVNKVLRTFSTHRVPESDIHQGNILQVSRQEWLTKMFQVKVSYHA